MSVTEIIAQVFRRYPQANYDISKLCRNHPVRDYCVQYNETDFDFVRRLCEEEGIYFYFHHSATEHKMVLEDWGFARVPFYCDTQVTCEAAGQAHFYRWSSKLTIESPTAMTRRQYRWQNPSVIASQKAFTQQPPLALADQELEHYAYPIDTPIDDDELSFREHVRTHLGRNPVGVRRIKAQGNYLGLEPGMLVQVSEHYQEQQIGSYQLIGLRLCLIPTERLAADHPQADTDAPHIIEVHARPINNEVRYIPPLRTPKPCISNVQTAKVVGPPEQELYTDSFARVKVQFHWDRYGQHNERSSPWLRCAAHWSADGYGTQFIPRQGQEVLTIYQGGYPHWPLVRATLPNPDNMLPFTPEQTPTRTGIKTHTIGSDDLQQGHLLQFDDHNSEPSIKLQSPRDMVLSTSGHSTRETGAQLKQRIDGGDLSHCVAGRLTYQAKNAFTLRCGASELTVNQDGIGLSAPSIQVDKNEVPALSLANMSSDQIFDHLMELLAVDPPIEDRTLEQPPANRLEIQICDFYNQTDYQSKHPLFDALIEDIHAKVTVEGKPMHCWKSICLISVEGPDFDQVSQVTLALEVNQGYMASQQVYIIGVNGKPTQGAQLQLQLKPADWQSLPPTKDALGTLIYRLTVTILPPALLFNYRQDAWSKTPFMSQQDREVYDALKEYLQPDGATLREYDISAPQWLFEYAKHNGNNITLFIHGFNVPWGEFGHSYALEQGQLKPQSAATLCQDDAMMRAWFGSHYDPKALFDRQDKKATALCGSGAHKWLVHMEHNLNLAAGFDGKDYSRYTRLVGIAWEGDVRLGSDYMASTPLTPFAAERITGLIRAFKDRGISVNVMAHSLGNEVLMNVLDACGRLGIEIDHVFMWEGAIPNNCFKTTPGQYLPMILNNPQLEAEGL